MLSLLARSPRAREDDLVLRVERLQVAGLPPLSFEVPDGECLAVEGASGAGKTLLLRAIADLDAATGDVTVDGEERREMPAHAWRRRVRYCAAEPAWWADTPRACLPTPLAAARSTGSCNRSTSRRRTARPPGRHAVDRRAPASRARARAAR